MLCYSFNIFLSVMSIRRTSKGVAKTFALLGPSELGVFLIACRMSSLSGLATLSSIHCQKRMIVGLEVPDAPTSRWKTQKQHGGDTDDPEFSLRSFDEIIF
jgi:hypothetical protein